MDHDDRFEFNGKRYGYTSNHSYQCEFCKARATWNAVTKLHPRYTFVCDAHFLLHCQQETKGRPGAARFRDPPSNWDGKLTTIGEFLQGVEELKAIYSNRGSKLGE